MRDSKSLRPNNLAEANNKLQIANVNDRQFATNAKNLELKIGNINSNVNAESQKIASKTQYYNVMGTAVKAVSDAISGSLRFGSRMEDIEGEKDSKISGLMSDSEQTYTESLRKISEMTKELVQSLHSMLQALDTPGTRITA